MRFRVFSVVLFAVALVVLRLQVADDMGIPYAKALGLGLADGFIRDCSIWVFLLGASLLLGAVSGTAAWPWAACFAAFLWVAALANALYFRFFSSRLDWWVVRLHWDDLVRVKGSAATLGVSWQVVASMVLVIAALAALFVRPGTAARAAPPAPGRPRRRMAVLAIDLMILSAAVQTEPILWRANRLNSVPLADQIVQVWFNEWLGLDRHEFMNVKQDRRRALKESLPGALSGAAGGQASVLAAFRDWHDPSRKAGAGGAGLAESRDPPDEAAGGAQGAGENEIDSPGAVPPPVEGRAAHAAVSGETGLVRRSPSIPAVENTRTPVDPAWPLVADLAFDPASTAALRARLGLPPEGPLNVLVLFLETFRSLELTHPDLAPQVVPRVRSILNRRSVQFTQVYSSALTAGQTVRGQFSTLCGTFPNIGGAAVYIAHPGLRVRCLQALFKDNGYQTIWLNGFARSYHNKFLFESLHGMETFFDMEHFRSRGVTKWIGSWGLGDRAVLEETVKTLEVAAAAGRPFFAHIITLSTHHPHSVIPEGPVPARIAKAAAKHADYLGYVSRLKYADEAVGNFFTRFFASPLSKNTVVFVVGDHSITTVPHVRLTDVQRREMAFRVPFGIVTAGLREPVRIDYPIHQADIAPIIAAVAGVSGRVTWIGRPAFSGEGTPWLYEDGGAISYRTASRLCLTPVGGREVRCVATPPGADPLLDPKLDEVPEDPAETAFFSDVIRANRDVIMFNKIMPP
ncbi:MAG: LTA synthase family protein [Deltaproteobacteria bacterium]|nr:LTA synthase family protein [Deltaproteobacteria bacterium]